MTRDATTADISKDRRHHRFGRRGVRATVSAGEESAQLRQSFIEWVMTLPTARPASLIET